MQGRLSRRRVRGEERLEEFPWKDALSSGGLDLGRMLCLIPGIFGTGNTGGHGRHGKEIFCFFGKDARKTKRFRRFAGTGISSCLFPWFQCQDTLIGDIL